MASTDESDVANRSTHIQISAHGNHASPPSGTSHQDSTVSAADALQPSDNPLDAHTVVLEEAAELGATVSPQGNDINEALIEEQICTLLDGSFSPSAVANHQTEVQHDQNEEETRTDISSSLAPTQAHEQMNASFATGQPTSNNVEQDTSSLAHTLAPTQADEQMNARFATDQPSPSHAEHDTNPQKLTHGELLDADVNPTQIENLAEEESLFFSNDDENHDPEEPGVPGDPNNDHDLDGEPHANPGQAEADGSSHCAAEDDLRDLHDNISDLDSELQQPSGDDEASRNLADMGNSSATHDDANDSLSQPASSTKTSKPRAKPAKTAREYFQRENKRELERQLRQLERKRKAEESGGNSRKVRRTGKASHHWPRWEHNKTNQSRSNVLHSIDDMQKAVAEGEVPSMGMIKAKTHKQQLAQFKANMAQGGDTRRSKSQAKDLEKAVTSFGYKQAKAHDGRYVLRNMVTGLLHYQATVASWMIKREVSETEPLGGILADEMGMGKTVVSLACITAHPPEMEDIAEYCKATLVVVPNRAVALQWRSEVEKHCKGDFKDLVQVYNRSENREMSYYRRQYVVITTYHEVMNQYPSTGEILEMKEQCSGDEHSFHRMMRSRQGDLFNVAWYRVILDEAHHIKNVASRTALACCSLNSKFRWILSGTPLSNTPEEFFPYLKFLGCKFTDSKLHFKRKYVVGDEAQANFEALVSLTMYRRTKKDTFLGCRILDLPDHTTQDIWVPLTHCEQIIFLTVHEHYRKILQKFSAIQRKRPLTEKEKEEQSKARHAMMTRLRQTVSHPFTLEKMFRTVLEADENQSMRQQLGKHAKLTMLEHLYNNANESNDISRFKEGISKLSSFKMNAMGGIFDMRKCLELAENEKRLRDEECPVCKKSPPKRPLHSARCEHVYCADCVVKLLSHGNSANCREPSCSAKLLAGCSIKTLPQIMEEAQNDKAYREPAADCRKVRIVREAEGNGFFTATARLEKVEIPPSSKLNMAMAVILQWQAQHPEDKIIVFTQFVMTGKILGSMLETAGFNFLYYYGSVEQGQRTKTIEAFKADSDKNILVTGLKCGGQALNLTAANRVILIDPWWNSTAEKQAFCRVLRIGQTKTTHLVRILTKSSIDLRISHLQWKKSIDIDFALQDDGHIPIQLDDERLEKLFEPIKKPTKRSTTANKPN